LRVSVISKLDSHELTAETATSSSNYAWDITGLSMYEALIGPLCNSGVRCASLTVLGGWFDSMQYCVASADASGAALVSYSEPISVGRSYLIFGNATIGLDQQDKLIVHCHGALIDETGVAKGGHVLTDRCIVGSETVCALVTTLDGFDLRVAFDPETNIPLLQPLDLKESGQ
jgi:hypothetical protein